MSVRRGPVARGGLPIFDSLEINTATLENTQTDIFSMQSTDLNAVHLNELVRSKGHQGVCV